MQAGSDAEKDRSYSSLRDYLRKNGIRLAIIVMSVAFLVALNAATRSGRTGFLQNMTGEQVRVIRGLMSEFYFPSLIC